MESMALASPKEVSGGGGGGGLHPEQLNIPRGYATAWNCCS